MTPIGLVLRNAPDTHYHLNNRWDKQPSMLIDFHNVKRDGQHSTSRGDNSSGSNSSGDNHGSGGFSDNNGNNGGGGSSGSGGFNGGGGFGFGSGSIRNGGFGGFNPNSGGGGTNNGNPGSGDFSNGGSGSSDKNNNNANTKAGFTQSGTTTTTFSASVTFSSPSPPGDNIAPTTVFITPSASSESSTPTSTSIGLPPTAQEKIHHVSLPLGSIIAIILGILFCITIGGVIYVFARPKINRLGGLWGKSRKSSPYLPSIASYEPKEARDSSNLYRPYIPQDVSTFPFASQAHLATHPGYNGASMGGFDNFQTQIYSTRLPGASSPQAERSLTSLHSYRSEEDDSIESLNRIMSMMDRYPFERNSAVDSGQISPNPSDHLSLNDDHYPRSVGPDTTTGE